MLCPQGQTCFFIFQEAEAEPEKNEPTEFTIKLTQFDAANKVKLIKEIKNLMPGLNLVQVCISVLVLLKFL